MSYADMRPMAIDGNAPMMTSVTRMGMNSGWLRTVCISVYRNSEVCAKRRNGSG